MRIRDGRAHIRFLEADFDVTPMSSPEQKLAASVILRALLDLVDPRWSSEKLKFWFRNKSDKPFSFLWSCQAAFPDEWFSISQHIRNYVKRGEYSELEKMRGGSLRVRF